MGQNFDVYPGFQQTPDMPILLQYSVCENLLLPLEEGKFQFLTPKKKEIFKDLPCLILAEIDE